MPEIIACPSCQRSLRVSDDLLGEWVKCPSCGTEFTASLDTPARGEINPQGEIVRDDSPYSVRGEEEPGVAPRSRSRRRDEYEEDDGRQYVLGP